jgi:hypothetical protein
MYHFEKLDTKQKIFDYVAKKLYDQGCTSLSVNGRCAYRGFNETKCAVGHLIPSNLYNRIMEGPLYLLKQATKSKRLKLFLDSNYDFLHDLQKVHDFIKPSYPFHPQLLQNLSNVAIKYKLQPFQPKSPVQ